MLLASYEVEHFRLIGKCSGGYFAWRRAGARLAVLAACLSLLGCFHLGPNRLDQDEVGYSQALGDSQNQQTLLNVVRLRYADTPSFLQATQIISSYQLQQSVTAGLQDFPGAASKASDYVTAGGSAQLQQSPTFTFQPIIGEQFAENFVRPLAPAELLPLIEGGTPIDVLFRLSVQSVNDLQNTRALGGNGGQGSPLFFLLLHDLRILQVAGLLDARQGGPGGGALQKDKASGQGYMGFGATSDPALAAAASEVRQLLGLAPTATGAPVIYGAGRPAPGQISILTRPMLGILNQLAVQVEVPPADIANGLTTPSIGNVGIEHRPVVIIHSGSGAPDHAFVKIRYDQTWFWIANDDFDSKVAFSVVQILFALAETTSSPGAVLTIPAG